MKDLSLLELVAIGIGGMIGGGIFAVLGLSIEISKGGAPISFAIGGLIALMTAYSYSKLSVKYKSRGGTVNFLIKIFGNNVFTGGLNIMLLLSYVIMLSLYAYAFGSYGATFFHFPAKHLLISFVILLFTFLNIMGSKIVGESEEAIVIVKLLILGMFVILGMFSADYSKLVPGVSVFKIVSGGMMIFLAYEGFELIANATEDAKRISDVKKAFFISVIFVTILYILVSIVAVGNLSFSDVSRYRDYALAEAAQPFLGKLGFILITIAALLSTSSAINATLYGSAKINYIIAKYGELPKVMEEKIWNRPIEGLIIVSLFTLLIANLFDLSEISSIGSSGFLIIFSFVNLANFKDERSYVSLTGFLACLFALIVFVANMKAVQIVELIGFVLLSFSIEYFYRKFFREKVKRKHLKI